MSTGENTTTAYQKKIFEDFPNSGKLSIIPAFLSPTECERLLKYGQEDKLKIGVVNRTNDINYSVRKNKVRFLKAEKHSELAWFFERVEKVVQAFNVAHALPSLKGLQSNQVQLSKYGKEDFYAWHQDCSPSIKRQLTFSIQLSPPEAYQEGHLQLFTPKGTFVVTKAIGTLSIFTSSTCHRVTPIAAGVRHSLVGWFM
ncbi:MAG: hypothetical protein Sapg2KO_43640 [Saprospiraceae bacterium]